MSILENTISMMKVLPEADLLEIQNFTKKLFRLRNVNSCFQPKRKKKILDDLATSRKQIAEGKSKEMGQAIEGIRKKYGL